MKKGTPVMWKFTAFFVLLVFLSAFPSFSDEREENIDVFLVLDKSLSMEEEIDAVKEYVRTEIVDAILQEGDSLVLIAFYGQADTLVAQAVGSSKADIDSVVADINANGRFTDIGNALDSLKAAVDLSNLYASEDRRKYLMLITDGKQEAPESSKYYSPDGSFNHFFLENTKTIQKEGWKIIIIGIGEGTAAQSIAEVVSGTVAAVSETPTSEEIAEATKDLLGIIEPTGIPVLRPIGESGKSTLVIRLASEQYSEARTVSISGISLQTQGQTNTDILTEPFTFTIEPDEELTVDIPVQVNLDLEPGDYDGTVALTFDGDTSITPAVMDTHVRIKGYIGNNLWIIPVAIAIIAALIILILLLVRVISESGSGNKGGGKGGAKEKAAPTAAGAAAKPKGRGTIKFTCEIEDGPVRKRAYEVKGKKILYVADSTMGITITPKKLGKPAATLYADGASLKMEILDAEKLKAKSVPANLLGKSLAVEKANGKKATLTFEKI